MLGSPMKKLTRVNAGHRGGVFESEAQAQGGFRERQAVWIWLEEKENYVLR